MKRYIFLLLAFFLSFMAEAAYSVGSVSAIPNVVPTSPRNARELGNLKESKQQAEQPALNNDASGVPASATKTKTTSVSSVSCKTYEGKIYDQGEAGYNDCIRTIKNDRQGTKTIP
jgi:hypothetical protein